MTERDIRCVCGKIHTVTISIGYEHVFGYIVGGMPGPTTITRTLGYICPTDKTTKQVDLDFEESFNQKIKYARIDSVRNRE